MFYSDPASSFYANGRLLAGPPSIARANTSVGTNSVVFDFQVVGDPAAGVQGVYITWTDGRGSWQTFPLTQDNLDTVRWRGELSLTNVNRPGFAYIVQAVSGIGLVAVDDNGGRYFGLTDTSPTQGGSPTPTTLTLDTPVATATVGDAVTFQATLATNQPLAGQVVTFQFGELTRTAVTGSDGRAQVTVRLDLLPSTYTLGASFNGAEGFATSSARSTVTTTVTRLATTLTASTTTASMSAGGDSNVAVTLRDGPGRTLLGAPVFFIITGTGVPNGAHIGGCQDELGWRRAAWYAQPAGWRLYRACVLRRRGTGSSCTDVRGAVLHARVTCDHRAQRQHLAVHRLFLPRGQSTGAQ